MRSRHHSWLLHWLGHSRRVDTTLHGWHLLSWALRLTVVHSWWSHGVTISHLISISEWIVLSLHVHDELLDQGEDFRSVENFHAELAIGLLLSVVVVVSLVSDFFLLKLSEFLDLVVVDVEHLTVEGLLMQLDLSLSSMLRVLVADKGV